MSNCNSKYMYMYDELMYDGDIITILRNVIDRYQSKNVYLQHLMMDDLKYLLKIHNSYIKKCNNSTSNKKYKAYRCARKPKYPKHPLKSRNSRKTGNSINMAEAIQRVIFNKSEMNTNEMNTNMNKDVHKDKLKTSIRKRIKNKIRAIMLRRKS